MNEKKNISVFVDTPRVTAHRSVINTKEGDHAELHCDFETSTESRVIWSKDQQQLSIGQLSHESRSKYSVIYGHPKAPNKNTSILVVSNVKSSDLGAYECKVENDIGAENVSFELTYVPEPPQLHNVENEGDVVITHWHIRSLQPLHEVMLNYQRKGVSVWLNSCLICIYLIEIYLHFTGKKLVIPKSNRSRTKQRTFFHMEVSINSNILMVFFRTSFFFLQII